LSYLIKLLRKIGVDAAITYTIIARIIQAGGGVVSILFIARYLSKIEQGYYFTFGSLLAIQIFFELGLSAIITQFVAHETANLYWISSSELEGAQESKSRLSSLLRFCIKWFLIIAVLLIVVLLITGYIFFTVYGKEDITVKWQLPWIILSISTACSLVVSPILAFLEGLGKVKEVAKIRLFQQITQLILLLIFLTFGLKLFSSPIASIITFSIVPIWVFNSYLKKLLLNIWHQIDKWNVNYKKEIFPYQWRIALSWISGYFIFQMFNPVLFATEGAIVAGQMGMTLAALSGVLSVSLSWINTKVPLFSGLIAKKQFKELDLIFNRTLKQANLICILCLCILVGAVMIMKALHLEIRNRFLPLTPLILLCLATFVNQLVSALATYLRCHKQEPFLVQSVVLAILTGSSTIVLGKFFGLNGIVIGYCSIICLISLTWSLIIFKSKKKQWHHL
jgi:O-antigen/teichoic acid export membrane protein